MQKDAQGQCFSYYGTWNNKTKPRIGVIYLMLDEHIKKMVKQEKVIFKKELNSIVSAFDKTIKSVLKKQAADIKAMNKSIKDLIKFTDRIIDLNELKKPKLSIVIPPKQKEYNEDNCENGYL